MAAENGLASIEHVVVLMLENRSFDHMLGFLYADQGNVSPAGQPYDGLTGSRVQPGCFRPAGNGIPDRAVHPERLLHARRRSRRGVQGDQQPAVRQHAGPASPADVPAGQGFIKDYAYTLGWQSREKGWPIVAGTVPGDIMGCFTPDTLPVLSALARGYAVCDQWFASVPTETLPNRAFACAATSQGHMDDKTRTFTSPSIFGLLGQHQVSWAIYGYSAPPLTKSTFTDISGAPAASFGEFAAFQSAAAGGTLPAFSFLEPSWGTTGNSQHPNYDVALGEQLMHDVYEAVRTGPGWPQTLLVITYDEHGGCYDHVPPPAGAVPPDDSGRGVRLRFHQVRGARPGRARLAADRGRARYTVRPTAARRWTTRRC